MAVLACLVLPMSRCTTAITEQVDARGNVVATTPEYSDVKAIDKVDGTWTGVVVVLAFLWPLLSQVLLLRFRWLEARRAWLLVELLPLAGTAWLGFSLATLGQDLRYGAFVLAMALAAYAVSTLWMAWRPAAVAPPPSTS
jgi:hypothetical protein